MAKDNKVCSVEPVYACESDLYHPLVLRLVLINKLLTEDRIELIRGGDKYTSEELRIVLENIWGFCRGNFDVEVIGEQRSRFGSFVTGENRYMGYERLDKDWVNSKMASDEVKEVYKHGEKIRL